MPKNIQANRHFTALVKEFKKRKKNERLTELAKLKKPAKTQVR